MDILPIGHSKLVDLNPALAPRGQISVQTSGGLGRLVVRLRSGEIASFIEFGPGATTQTYGPFPADTDDVTLTNISCPAFGYEVSGDGKAAGAPIAITGTPAVGETLTASVGTGWLNSGGIWTRDGVDISGETGLTHIVTERDYLKQLTYKSSNLPFIPPAVTGAAGSALALLAVVGDSNSMRYFNSTTGCTITASAGTATVTLPLTRELLPGQRIIVYSAGAAARPILGEFVIATRISNTQFTYAYTGTDSEAGGSFAIAFGNSLSDSSPITWMLMYLRQRMAMYKMGAVGGETAAETLALRLPGVIAAKPQVASVMLGTNDITQGRTVAAITADMAAIYDALRAAGIKIIAVTTPPRVDGTSPQNLAISQLAQYTRDYAALYPGQVYLVDAHAMGITPGNPTGPARAVTMWDGSVHFSLDYARQVGKAMATVMDSISIIDYRTVPTGVGGGNAVANPRFVDSNSDGTADGVTISYSGASGTPTVVPAAGGVGNAQRLSVVATAATQNGQISLDSIHAGLTAGKRYRLVGALSWGGNLAAIRAFVIGLNITAGGVSYILRAISAFTGETYPGPLTESGTALRFMTDPFVAPASMTVATPIVQVTSHAAGTFTFEVSECFTEEVA